jgi:hypothetical protein
LRAQRKKARGNARGQVKVALFDPSFPPISVTANWARRSQRWRARC